MTEDPQLQQGKSGKWYKVAPYEEQKRKHPGSSPRGICCECEGNPTLRRDNTMRIHNSAPYTQCKGSHLPSLGLPVQYR